MSAPEQRERARTLVRSAVLRWERASHDSGQRRAELERTLRLAHEHLSLRELAELVPFGHVMVHKIVRKDDA